MLLAATPNGGYGWQLLLLFMARAGIEGSFCALYVYTPEVGSSSLPFGGACAALGL